MEAEAIIETLGLSPHPEGGWYRETWRADARAGERAAGTAIYFLLKKGERSHWHYIDAAEVWHFYAGAPLKLSLSADGKKTSEHLLGPDMASGARPQIVVPQGCWQAGESLGDYTLVGCTVSPAFEFASFEMAPKDWSPSGA